MSTSTIHETAEQLADLFVRKNEAYGDSIGKSVEMLKLLFPNGIGPDYYLDAILYARRFDKWSRLAQGADLHGEDPRIDDAGYALYALHQAKEATTWPGNASAPDAPTPSKAPLAFAPASTRPKTTATDDASSASPRSPSSESSPASSSASASTSSPASAPAPIATANVNANAEDLESARKTFKVFAGMDE